MEGSQPPDQNPVAVVLASRIQRALAAFEKLNQGRAQTEPAYAPPLTAQLEARLDALIAVLASRGVVDVNQLMVEALARHAQMLEGAVHACADHKRQTTGVIIPTGVPHPDSNGQAP